MVILLISSCVLTGQPTGGNKYSSPLYIDPLDINIKDFDIINTGRLAREADGYYEREEYIKAAKNYLLVVNNDCNNCESYFKLSRCYAMLKHPSLAAHFLTLAVETGYTNYIEIASEEAFKKARRDMIFRNAMDDALDRTRSLGEIVWVKQTRFDRVRLFYPAGYDREKSYPLLIALHGRGDNAINFSSLWSYISGRGIILAVPEGPYTFSTRGGIESRLHTWDLITRDPELMAKADPEVTAFIAGISSDLNSRLNVSSTILLGFSQGAAYAYAAGIRYHDSFDGLICLGGRIPDTSVYPWFLSGEEMARGNNLSVFVGHGTLDQAISYTEGEKSARLLEEMGYDVKFSLFEGGHFIQQQILNEALDWLLPMLP